MATPFPTRTSGAENVASLCSACQLLSFSDEGFQEACDDDVTHLVFPGSEEAWDADGSRSRRAFPEAPIEPQRIGTGFEMKDRLPELPNLSESSRQGCDFCGVLRSAISSSAAGDTRLEDLGTEVHIEAAYLWQREESGRGGLLILHVKVDFDKIDIPLRINCLAQAVPDSKNVGTWLGLGLPQDYSEEKYIGWMKHKMTDCEDHEHGSAYDDFIPKRLIDVQTWSPKLVRGEDLGAGSPGPDPRYAALSYCWGSSDDAETQIKTTADSLLEREEGISDIDMTQVLRDAVHVTRALSIPYLWVDALCVLQDDNSDWERQCVDMSKVFGNAHVTFCAGSSNSCHEGFLRRNGRRIRMPFSSALRPGFAGSYSLKVVSSEFSRHDYYYATDDITTCRLAGRGWAYQESISSRRRVWFGDVNLHFLCGDSFETMGGTSLDHPYDYCFRPSSASRLELYEEWNGILESYSRFNRLSFTNPSDTLPALSGIAKHFSNGLGDGYVAGHWNQDLLLSLMWEGFPPKKPAQRHISGLQAKNNYLVPSWSRLTRGYTDCIRSNRCYQDPRPEFDSLYARTELAGGNPFGAITNGWLHIRSSVLDLATLDRDKLAIRPGGRATVESILEYDGQCVGDFGLDFRDEPCELNEHVSENKSSILLEDTESFKWVLLGSCKVMSPRESADSQSSENANRALESPGRVERNSEELESRRGAFGLILHSAANSDKFYRVGTFCPPTRTEPGAGLDLFRSAGEIKTVVVF